MAISTVVEGALVAHHVNPYDFTDDVTERQVKGESLRLFVCQHFDQPPSEVKVRDRVLFDSILNAYGMGSKVRLECEVVARKRGNRAITELQLVQVLSVDAEKKAS